MRNKQFRILVVDDDRDYAQTCAKVIGRAGYNVSACNSTEAALAMVRADCDIRLVLTDLRMTGRDGLGLLRDIKERDSSVEVIIMTGYGSIESAVEAIRHQATDYVTKPFDKNELLNAISKVYKTWELQHELRRLKRVLRERLDFDGFLFRNKKMLEVYERALAAAQTNCSVLITGESGTGKEVIARAIHDNSLRVAGPFIAINCSTLSGELLESELFGYRRGAFTGAAHDYPGLFLAADHGTLCLDEIAEMPQRMQAKLLRSIQNRSVRPVGSIEEIGVDVRFIAITNVDIQEAMAQKRFREDLYHRLNVIPIPVPPLREMADEVPALFEFLVERANSKHEHTVKSVDDHVMKLLANYRWPGNIREMENLVERLFSVERVEVITARNLPPYVVRSPAAPKTEDPVPQLSEAERDLVMRALREAKGNKSRAAEILGISRPRLYKKIQLYNIKIV